MSFHGRVRHYAVGAEELISQEIDDILKTLEYWKVGIPEWWVGDRVEFPCLKPNTYGNIWMRFGKGWR